MSSLHLAHADDVAVLAPLLAGFLSEVYGDTATDPSALLAPYMAPGAMGAIYLIGLRRAPVGFLALGFAQDLLAGGVSADLQALYIRPAVRRRGLAGEALAGIQKALKPVGICAIRMDVPVGATPPRSALRAVGFKSVELDSRFRSNL